MPVILNNEITETKTLTILNITSFMVDLTHERMVIKYQLGNAEGWDEIEHDFIISNNEDSTAYTDFMTSVGSTYQLVKASLYGLLSDKLNLDGTIS
jgi:hypothetical protein